MKNLMRRTSVEDLTRDLECIKSLPIFFEMFRVTACESHAESCVALLPAWECKERNVLPHARSWSRAGSDLEQKLLRGHGRLPGVRTRHTPEVWPESSVDLFKSCGASPKTPRDLISKVIQDRISPICKDSMVTMLPAMMSDRFRRVRTGRPRKRPLQG